jgi:hypothetical protein
VPGERDGEICRELTSRSNQSDLHDFTLPCRTVPFRESFRFCTNGLTRPH